jgi:hypothetical protein
MTDIRIERPCPAVPGNDPLDKFKPSDQALQAAADKWWLKDAHARLNKTKRALRKARVKCPDFASRNSGKPFYANLDGSGVQPWKRCRW